MNLTCLTSVYRDLGDQFRVANNASDIKECYFGLLIP